MTKKQKINESANKAYDMLKDLVYGDPDDEFYMSPVKPEDILKEIGVIINLTKES